MGATLVSPLHGTGEPWPRAATVDAVALGRAEADKRTTYPELVDSGVVRLATVACEVGGRWSPAALCLLRQAAAARARQSPAMLQASAAAAWRSRWLSLLSVAQQDALAASLVDDGLLLLDGRDGPVPCAAEVWVDVARA